LKRRVHGSAWDCSIGNAEGYKGAFCFARKKGMKMPLPAKIEPEINLPLR
jgi:hypothetical protein